MKILFITHESSRTGAPLVLLRFIEWLRFHKPEINITIIDLNPGNLAEEFKINSDYYHNLESFKPLPKTFIKEFQKKILFKIGKYKNPIHPKDLFLMDISNSGFDIIYANSVVSLPVANQIKKLSSDSKLILHVHELKTIIDEYVPKFNKIYHNVDKFISVSNMVRKQLINNYNINSNKVEVIYEFSKIENGFHLKKDKQFLVGSSGTVHWRKGNDLFIQVARYLKTHYKDLDIKFEWIGRISEKERRINEADLEKAGINKIVNFIGEKRNPVEFYKDFDILFLCSREDPFPLVAIELGRMGKPIICFEGATGISEVLINGGGEIVPYLNIEAVAEKIVEYYDNKMKLEKDGRIAKDLFSEFSPEKICPMLFNKITKV